MSARKTNDDELREAFIKLVEDMLLDRTRGLLAAQGAELRSRQVMALARACAELICGVTAGLRRESFNLARADEIMDPKPEDRP